MDEPNLLWKVNIRINFLTLKTQSRMKQREGWFFFFPNINTFIISCNNLDDENRNYLCFHLISQLQVKTNNLIRRKAFHGKTAILRSEDSSRPVSKHCMFLKPKNALGNTTPNLQLLALISPCQVPVCSAWASTVFVLTAFDFRKVVKHISPTDHLLVVEQVF